MSAKESDGPRCPTSWPNLRRLAATRAKSSRSSFAKGVHEPEAEKRCALAIPSAARLFRTMSSEAEFTPSTLAALHLSGHGSGLVKKLRGFRKDRHTVPDAVNAATQAFFARLCAEEVAEEGEQWFQRAKTTLGYKRRDLTLTLGNASALLQAKDFTLETTWSLNEADPNEYAVSRTLRDFTSADFVLGPGCDEVFASTFTEIVFTLARGVAVEAVVDAVEALSAESALTVQYPANCSECTLGVPHIDATVRCTGATLEMIFPSAGSPRELIEAFGRVRAAFRFTQDTALAGLL
jgi:hypothetical protein